MKATIDFRTAILRGALAAVLLAGLLPATASAACAGKLSMLQPYAGQYLADHGLLDAPALAAVLQRLPAGERLHLRRNLDVSGPIELAGCHLVVSGNAPHMGTEQDAMLDVDLASGTVIAAIHGGGRIDIHVLADPGAPTPRWDALPRGLREWAVRADMGFPQQRPRNLAQPRSVHLHAVPPGAATASAAPRAAGKPLLINFDKHAVRPDAAQAAAIRRAAGDALTQPLPGHSGEPLYAMALADLNDDGRADLIVQFTYASGFCGSAGCSGVIVMAKPGGYAGKPIGLPNFSTLAVLPALNRGMHDLQFDGDSPIWRWTGKEYAIAKADLPGSGAPPWQTRNAAGRTLAMAIAIDSVIKDLTVFCNQGKPVLAMLVKARPPSQRLTLTFVFRGWTVNVPMGQGNRDGTLWLADLSRSDLPEWLAHRGKTRTTRELARLADMAYLRIDGGMQGRISLEGSTAATQAALGTCYRY